MADLDRMAYDAGFRRAGQITTATDPDKSPSFGGMDVVTSPLMPEGYVAFRTDKGAMIVPPNGKMWWLSFEMNLPWMEPKS